MASLVMALSCYSVLIMGSMLSFLPHLWSIVVQKASNGIAASYVLINIICVTEQFTLAFAFILADQESNYFSGSVPRTAIDWLNLVQHGATLIAWLVFFMFWLYFLPQNQSALKIATTCAYTAFLLISIIPAVAISMLPPRDSRMEEELPAALFYGFHMMLLSPILTISLVFGFLAQLKVITRYSSSLSQEGLVLQIVIFFLLSFSWFFRTSIPFDIAMRMTIHAPVSWFQVVGWAVVDNGLFAVGQGAILWAIRNRSRQETLSPALSEGTSLLQAE